MLSIHATVAQSASEVDGIAAVWRRIFRSAPDTLFQSFAWNRLAAESFQDQFTPLVVAVEADDGAAIIPAALNLASKQIEFLGESLFDYRDVLHVGNPEVLRLAWQKIAEFGMPLSVTAIQAEAAQRRWPGFPLTPFVNATQVRRAFTTEAQFRTAHHRMERRLKRIQEQGAVLRTYTGDDSALVRYLYGCKGDQFATDESNLFRDKTRRDFMVQVAAKEGKRCEIFTLQSQDEILLAGLVTFRDANCRRFYTVYFDPDWAVYSPGVLLVYETTARSLADGLDCDYMTGEYPYKMRFANSSCPLYKVEVTAAALGDIVTKHLIASAA